jgi:hypothetical protein
MRRTGIALLAVIALLACRRSPPVATAFDLPDEIEGFAAGARERGDRFVRRTYTSGAARITVTLARHTMDDRAYDGWVAMSTANFPQADLGLPAGAANGFYQCSGGAPETCDLLIQLRVGVHVEIRGGGTSSRAQVDAIRRGLPLPALAGSSK